MADSDGTGGHGGHSCDGGILTVGRGFGGGGRDSDRGGGVGVGGCDRSDHSSTGGYGHGVGGDLVMVGFCVPRLRWA